MAVPARLAAFAAVLAVLFGAGALAGDLVGPERDSTADAAHSSPADEHTGTGSSADDRPVRGLSVAEAGLRLAVVDAELRPGRPERLEFRIVDDRGETVRDFDVEHERRMHLILTRRDLTGFQHLHPEQDADGTWSTIARIDEPGSYRLFADFSRDGEPHTLASDLRVDGRANLRPLPAPESVASSDGYDVRLEADAGRPGEEAELRFAVTKDGAPVRTEPYLGAGGHLVALREGDLAFLHVHPTEHGDREVAFAATFPTEGRYRLFLQFEHEGRVHTAAFTQEVE